MLPPIAKPMFIFVAAGLALSAARAAVPVVVGGRAEAVIVTADRPTAVAQYAAKELAEHIQLATGVRLLVTNESAATTSYRIVVGDCAAAKAAGISVSQLPPETFVMRTTSNALILAGDDAGGDPLSADTRAGTLWAVYEWLDSALGVRWLWPGALGTIVPNTNRVIAGDLNETCPPRFFQRKLRSGLTFESEHPALGFTPKAFEQFAQEQNVFLRRHRMGRSYPVSYGHAFVDWWQKFGKEHPEWFQQREGGARGPSKSKGRFSMCVSNPDFQRQVVSLWEKRRGEGSGSRFLNACENDIPGNCLCPACRAWDGPTPPDYLTHYSAKSKVAGMPFVSDRYAHFWLAVQQMAARKDPEATVIGYVYFNYFQAPTSGIKLNPHILLGFCPSGGWFPRSPAEHDWMKAQWTGWRNTGARLFLRANYLLDGYCMPYIYAHQFADEFQHEVRNGLTATDLDSLTGHWSTQGPNLYLTVRLHERPEANVEALLAEYYAGFGPAAAAVQAYFDYWENYTTTGQARIAKTMDDLETSRWRNWAKAAHAIFPPDCFAPAEALLAQAAKQAGADRAAAQRVDFLQKGLAHAKLCARAASLLTLADAGPAKPGAEQALRELVAFRRANERLGLGNFNHLAWVEASSWKLSAQTKQSPDIYP